MTMTIPEASSLVEYNETQEQLIQELFFKGKGSTNDFNLFKHVCISRRLDPFMRQIFPVFRKTKIYQNNTEAWVDVMTIQTGIDGYRLIADRTGTYAPGRSPTFTYDKEGNLVSAKAFVKKQTKDGTWHEVEAEAFWSEFVQKDKSGKPTKFWEQMPKNQLAKCAEALALRKANPADLSGIYTNEEMQQADVIEVSNELDEVPKKEQPKPIVPKIAVLEPKITQMEAETLTKLLSCITDKKKKESIDGWIVKMGFDGIENISANKYAYVFGRIQATVDQLSKEAITTKIEPQLYTANGCETIGTGGKIAIPKTEETVVEEVPF